MKVARERRNLGWGNVPLPLLDPPMICNTFAGVCDSGMLLKSSKLQNIFNRILFLTKRRMIYHWINRTDTKAKIRDKKRDDSSRESLLPILSDSSLLLQLLSTPLHDRDTRSGNAKKLHEIEKNLAASGGGEGGGARRGCPPLDPPLTTSWNNTVSIENSV